MQSQEIPFPTTLEEAKALVNKCRQQHANRICFDCPARNPSWCSITYGIFLCMECCGRHRSMGVHISYMKSTELDSWQPIDSYRIAMGGNAAAFAFFSAHGMTDTKMRYTSVSAQMYKKKLDQLVNNRGTISMNLMSSPTVFLASPTHHTVSPTAGGNTIKVGTQYHSLPASPLTPVAATNNFDFRFPSSTAAAVSTCDFPGIPRDALGSSKPFPPSSSSHSLTSLQTQGTTNSVSPGGKELSGVPPRSSVAISLMTVIGKKSNAKGKSAKKKGLGELGSIVMMENGRIRAEEIGVGRTMNGHLEEGLVANESGE